MEKIFIKESKKYENGAVFEFRYVGIPFENYNAEKANKLIDAFLNKKMSHGDMLKDVAYLRTILSCSKEKLLVVEFTDGNNNEIAKYEDGILTSYESKKCDDKSSNNMEVKYQVGSALNISFSDFQDKSIVEYPNIKEMKNKFDEVVEHINSLTHVKPVYLNDDAKAIIETYKLFYGENPDFSKGDINIKIQTMLLILAQFGISLGDYSFRINEIMPESLALLQMVNSLFPLGEVTVIEDPVQLKEGAKKTIKLIGETISEDVDRDYDQHMKALMTISKTIYAGHYASDYNVDKLLEYPNIDLTSSEVDKSVQLVKKIEWKLNDNKLN